MELHHCLRGSGFLDLLYSPAGGGFEKLVEDAIWVDVGEGWVAAVASMDDIIRSKELANRPKDQQTLPDLYRFRDQQKRDREGLDL